MTRSIVSRATYDTIYNEGSSRLANEGLIGLRYRLPKSFSFLHKRYKHAGPLDVLEIGSGVGEVAHLLLGSDITVTRYVGTEYSLPAVRKIHAQGLDCAQMNAEQLAFPDNSFDLVFCFDVMHHVEHPQRMAHEIVRVTRKHFLLCESNGASPVRKLVEFGAKERALGERSYLPQTYRSFFPQDKVGPIEVHPYYVLVPPYVPEPLIPLVATMSEVGERIAGWRWLGQSVLIAGEKRQG